MGHIVGKGLCTHFRILGGLESQCLCPQDCFHINQDTVHSNTVIKRQACGDTDSSIYYLCDLAQIT